MAESRFCCWKELVDAAAAEEPTLIDAAEARKSPDDEQAAADELDRGDEVSMRRPMRGQAPLINQRWPGGLWNRSI